MGQLRAFRGSRGAGSVDQSVEIPRVYSPDAFFHLAGTLRPQPNPLMFQVGHPVERDGMIRSRCTRSRCWGCRHPSRIHDDEMPELGEVLDDREHLAQHRRALDKSHPDIRVIEDVGDLSGGDIGGAGNIGRPAELHRRIGLDPLEAVVGEDRDMIARLDTERVQSLGKSQGSVPPLPVGDRVKSTLPVARGECRTVTPPLPRLPEQGGKGR